MQRVKCALTSENIANYILSSNISGYISHIYVKINMIPNKFVYAGVAPININIISSARYYSSNNIITWYILIMYYCVRIFKINRLQLIYIVYETFE